MKKVALVFAVAVLLPSLVLAWLAVRSLRDQQYLLERQQSLLDQRVTDSVAQTISDQLAQRQQEFSAQVEQLATNPAAGEIATQFDARIRQTWPLAEVGFCATLSGKILSPSPNARPAAQMFYIDNKDFLGNRAAVEVYPSQNYVTANGNTFTRPAANSQALNNDYAGGGYGQTQSSSPAAPASNPGGQTQRLNAFAAQARKVSPQNVLLVEAKDAGGDAANNFSKVIPAEAGFAQLIGSATDGMLARFLQNQLKLIFWHRLTRQPDLVYGAQLDLNRVVAGLRGLVQPDPALTNDLCLALLDDNAKPVALSRPDFSANWKRPFVATEIGAALPHWEVAAYLVNPAALTQAARAAALTLGLLVAVLVLAIGVGSWLIVGSLNSELKLARQKTDFVSNVSHELKTPLTSIRMFSELLAEGRVTDAAKQRAYLNIITAEAARLTRLINNVLDFSRLESGEKKYHFQSFDLTELVRATAEMFRPHLEAAGFKFDCQLPSAPVAIHGDADALAQIIVNLLSNAEKYSHGGKEITLQLAPKPLPLPHVEIQVLDRGSGVPRGSEEMVFEKFYRAHDSLNSGIQGSGLGLTIARQIARAHGGEVVCEPRAGGGSCFSLRIPLHRGEPA